MSGFLLCVLSFCEHFKEGTMAACELITYYFTFIGSYILGVLWQNPAGVWDGNDQDPGSACLAKAWSRTRQPGWDDGSWLILKQLKLPRKLCLCWFFVIFLNFTLRHHLKNVGRFSVSLGTWWRLWESHLHSGRILALPSSPLPGQVPGCSISCFLNTTPFRSTAKNPPPPQRMKRQLRLNSTKKLISAGEQALSGLLQITLQNLQTGSWITLCYNPPCTHTLEHPKKRLFILPIGIVWAAVTSLNMWGFQNWSITSVFAIYLIKSAFRERSES